MSGPKSQSEQQQEAAGSSSGSASGPAVPAAAPKTTLIYPVKSLLSNIQPAQDQPELPPTTLAGQILDDLLQRDTAAKMQRTSPTTFIRTSSTGNVPAAPAQQQSSSLAGPATTGNSHATSQETPVTSTRTETVSATFPFLRSAFAPLGPSKSPLTSPKTRSPAGSPSQKFNHGLGYFPPFGASTPSNPQASAINATAEPQTPDNTKHANTSAAHRQATLALSHSAPTKPSTDANPAAQALPDQPRAKISQEVSSALTNAISASSIGDDQRDREHRREAPRNLTDITILGPVPDPDPPKGQHRANHPTRSSRSGTGAQQSMVGNPSDASEGTRSSSGVLTGSSPGLVGTSDSGPTEDRATTSSGGSSSGEDIPITVRYKYVQDAHGNHLVVGREGIVARCEDEPIHMPGSIQSHGVLIVLEENLEDGSLVVRQVSENAGDILGLSPAYLFSLYCFSEVVAPDYQDVFWKNLTFLHDPNLDHEDEQAREADSPQSLDPNGSPRSEEPAKKKLDNSGPDLFLLNGFIQPATMDPREYRPQWKAWCAAHRPSLAHHPKPTFSPPATNDEQPHSGVPSTPASSGITSPGPSASSSRPFGSNRAGSMGDTDSDSFPPSFTGSSTHNIDGFAYPPGYRSVICLEFELVNDHIHPLYPSAVERPTSTGGEQSPATGSRTSGSATSSGAIGGGFSSGSVEAGGGSSGPGNGSSGYATTMMAGNGEGATPPSSGAHASGSAGSTPDAATPAPPMRLTNAAVQRLPVASDHNMQYLNQDRGESPSGTSLFEDTALNAPASTPPLQGTAGGGAAGVGTTSAGSATGTLEPPGGNTTVAYEDRDADDGDSDDDEALPDGAHTWYPTPQDIAESTTSHSKPIHTLEKMRAASYASRGGHRGNPVLARMYALARGRASRASSRGSRAGLGSTSSLPGHMSASVSSGSSSAGGSSYGGHAAHQHPGDPGVGILDVFTVLQEIIQQLGECTTLDQFLKVVVGVVKDVTQFHRILVYQFDEAWNGQVVSELLDWSQSHDLYMGLHFPATDIPAQARQLYMINKVRSLYDRDARTARLIGREASDLEYPLDMTHCYLRAMSPIHLKYLANMGVRASMSVSITAFGQLWGLITCHSYGEQGMRVSFPVRQLLKLMSDTISRNLERLSYAQRLQTRKLISTMPNGHNPSGYIVSNADDLLSLFDADYGVLAIGDGAKILGSNEHGTELLIVAQYLRMKQFTLMQVSQNVFEDYPDLNVAGMDVLSGMLYVPLSKGGRDFLVLLRRGQLRDVFWAGRPRKNKGTGPNSLEPRRSFKAWGHTVMGRCRAWTDEQLETAGVLALVYGKFIEVWREKETAVKSNQLASLLLTNASHEVRTPLNQIINFLELALEGRLEDETRKNLEATHAASKSLLFTINDLLDLTRLETGYATSATEPFDLPALVQRTVKPYESSAASRGIKFNVDTTGSPQWVIGDSRKISTVIANLTANAVKYTSKGSVTVECHPFREPNGLREGSTAVEIIVADTGCGIKGEHLQRIFRVLEQVEPAQEEEKLDSSGLGLGLAVVARIVEQVQGQLRVDSSEEGSRFSFLLPFSLPHSAPPGVSPGHSLSSLPGSHQSGPSEIDSWVSAFSSNNMGKKGDGSPSSLRLEDGYRPQPTQPKDGMYDVQDSRMPIRALKMDQFDVDKKPQSALPTPAMEVLRDPMADYVPQPPVVNAAPAPARISARAPPQPSQATASTSATRLRILIVDDDPVNLLLLVKRLTKDGHRVETAQNGDLAVKHIEQDHDFDCILMDIQMPIKNGFEATRDIRALEKEGKAPHHTNSQMLNGRIPIIAVSASLEPHQQPDLVKIGMDGWMLKPIKFDRTRQILLGILDLDIRRNILFSPTRDWEHGGWLHYPDRTTS